MVTIKEIAEQAQVSEGTVCNVLTGRYCARQPRALARAARIRQLAEQLGYRPNVAARAMAQGRFGCAALLLAGDGHNRSIMSRHLLTGIHKALAEKEMHLTVTQIPDIELTNPLHMPKILRELCCDGLLINYTKAIPPRMADLIHRHRIACIWINAKRDNDCVYPDDLAAGRKAVHDLAALGHRRIAYLTFSLQMEDDDIHYSEHDRMEGYRQAMRELGLSEQIIRRESWGATTRLERLDALTAWMRSPARPTAVIAYGHSSVMGPLLAAERAGLRIPQDLSLVTFGSEAVAAGYRVTTAIVPDEQVGALAVGQLLKRIRRPDEHLAPLAVPFSQADPGDTCMAWASA